MNDSNLVNNIESMEEHNDCEDVIVLKTENDNSFGIDYSDDEETESDEDYVQIIQQQSIPQSESDQHDNIDNNSNQDNDIEM